MSVRRVSEARLEIYLSELRMAHMNRGHFSPWMKLEVVKLMITGANHRDQVRRRMGNDKDRLPVTHPML